MKKISLIQFKRGKKATLEAKLTAASLGVLKEGEPAFETDTNKLKIGDGVNDYADLSYITGTDVSESGGQVDLGIEFLITDPLENQILLYDAESQKWVNRVLTDEESIIYLDSETKGLSLKGYAEAEHGQMLVKDATNGLAWIDPVNTTTLNSAVASAEAAQTASNNSAVAAANSQALAETAATNAQNINTATMDWFNKKFWWGSLEEYNSEIETNGLNPGTFYFIRPEN